MDPEVLQQLLFQVNAAKREGLSNEEIDLGLQDVIGLDLDGLQQAARENPFKPEGPLTTSEIARDVGQGFLNVLVGEKEFDHDSFVGRQVLDFRKRHPQGAAMLGSTEVLFGHGLKESFRSMLSADRDEQAQAGIVPEVLVGALNIPGAIQAVRDIITDVREDDVGWGTGLAAVGAIPLIGPAVKVSGRIGKLRDAAKFSPVSGDKAEALTLWHRSPHRLETVAPSAQGTRVSGNKGAERGRPGREPASYFYVGPPSTHPKEAQGFGDNLHRVEASGTWYDTSQPMNPALRKQMEAKLVERGLPNSLDPSERVNALETVLKENGYMGMVTSNADGTGVATMFNEVPVDFVPVETQRTVERVMNSSEGATIDLKTGESPTDGFALSPYKDREVEVPVLDENILYKYVNDNRDALARAGHHLGVWTRDGEGAVLDVSVVKDTPEEAIELAGESFQQAVWDIGAGQEIPVPDVPVQDLFRKATGGKNVEDLFPAVRARMAREGADAEAIADDAARKFLNFYGGTKIPIPLSHGTQADVLTEFDAPGPRAFGIHFGTENAANQRLQMTRPDIPPTDRNILNVALKMENPMSLFDHGGWHWMDVLDEIAKKYPNELRQAVGGENPSETYARATDWIKSRKSTKREPLSLLIQEMGFDGVQYNNQFEIPAEIDATLFELGLGTSEEFGHITRLPEYGVNDATDDLLDELAGQMERHGYESFDDLISPSYIVFNPDQIKSTSNLGSFLKKNPNIMIGFGAGMIGAGVPGLGGDDKDDPIFQSAGGGVMTGLLAMGAAGRGRKLSEVIKDAGKIPGWNPNQTAQNIFDRSLATGEPFGPQKGFERLDTAGKGGKLEGRAEALIADLTPKDKQLIRDVVESGVAAREGSGFYETRPFRAFLEETGSPLSLDFWTSAIAPTSAQASLPVNLGAASVLGFMEREGVTLGEALGEYRKRFSHLGGRGQFITEDVVRRVPMFRAKDPAIGTSMAQKTGSFQQNLLGNLEPLTADAHFARATSLLAPDAEFKRFGAKSVDPDVYGVRERVFNEEIVKPLGLTPAQAQAGLWFRAAPVTGVRSLPGDFTQQLENSVFGTARTLGIEPTASNLRHLAADVFSGRQFLDPLYVDARKPGVLADIYQQGR